MAEKRVSVVNRDAARQGKSALSRGQPAPRIARPRGPDDLRGLRESGMLAGAGFPPVRVPPRPRSCPSTTPPSGASRAWPASPSEAELPALADELGRVLALADALAAA